MIVSEIAPPSGYDINEEPYWDDASAITVLESTFSDYYANKNSGHGYGVLKTRNLTDLKDSETSSVKQWSIYREKYQEE